jgi:ERF superfamily protein
MGRELGRGGSNGQGGGRSYGGGDATPTEMPEITYTDEIVDPEDVPVFKAWGRVMRDVKAIAKRSLLPVGGDSSGKKVAFRGINEVYAYIGPALRRHGVFPVPHRTETSYRDTKSSRGSVMRECTVTVTFRVYGPTGDYFEGQAAGEATDTGDKATSKAQSIAYRVFLLESVSAAMSAEPDPESVDVERGESFRSAFSYAAEICAEGTSPGRLRQIWTELTAAVRLGEEGRNESNQTEALGDMITRIVKNGRSPAMVVASDGTWPEPAAVPDATP